MESIFKYVFLLFFVSWALSCAQPDVRKPTNAAQEKAQMIQSCTQAHGMLRDNEIRTQKVNSYGETYDIVDRFQFCIWPTTYYTNPDGYYDIVVRSERGPGESHATGVSIATYLKSDCRKLKLYTSFGHMGAYEHYPPFTAEIGSVVEARGEIYDGREGSVYPYPDRDEVVLLTGHAGLDRAECIE